MILQHASAIFLNLSTDLRGDVKFMKNSDGKILTVLNLLRTSRGGVIFKTTHYTLLTSQVSSWKVISNFFILPSSPKTNIWMGSVEGKNKKPLRNLTMRIENFRFPSNF